MILAKRPRSDAERGRAGSHKKSKITLDFATSYCYQGPGYLNVFFTNSQDGICYKRLYAQFLEIHRFTTFLSQPALLCRFQELMNWRGVRSTTRLPVWITQNYWRATTEGVDQQHCRWWFFDENPYSTAQKDHFLIPYPFCAKNTFCLVEAMITNVFWVQDSIPHFPLRCVGILKLSTHTA